jgi:hypothetical protein
LDQVAITVTEHIGGGVFRGFVALEFDLQLAGKPGRGVSVHLPNDIEDAKLDCAGLGRRREFLKPANEGECLIGRFDSMDVLEEFLAAWEVLQGDELLAVGGSIALLNGEINHLVEISRAEDRSVKEGLHLRGCVECGRPCDRRSDGT